jgi:hypothetical protein
MSVTRVLVLSNDLSPAAFMASFKKNVEPSLKLHKKEKILNRWTMVDAGDRWLLMTEFNNKTQMIKFVKAMASIRATQQAATNGQSWAYTGTVKATG